jgi:hypothetical protein
MGHAQPACQRLAVSLSFFHWRGAAFSFGE